MLLICLVFRTATSSTGSCAASRRLWWSSSSSTRGASRGSWATTVVVLLSKKKTCRRRRRRRRCCCCACGWSFFLPCFPFFPFCCRRLGGSSFAREMMGAEYACLWWRELNKSFNSRSASFFRSVLTHLRLVQSRISAVYTVSTQSRVLVGCATVVLPTARSFIFLETSQGKGRHQPTTTSTTTRDIGEQDKRRAILLN